MEQLSFFAEAGQSKELPNALLEYHPEFIDGQTSDLLLQKFIAEMPWKQTTQKMWDKAYLTPRLTSWHGDIGTDYSVSGKVSNPNPWTPELLMLKNQVEAVAKIKFNSVLLNYYRKGMVVRNTLAFTKIVKRPYKKPLPENPQTLGEHIMRKRLQSRLLQRDVAVLLGVSEDSVTYWENNRARPQIHHYPAIISYLGYYPFGHEIESFAGKIKKLRYSSGYSYEQLGAILGVNASTVRGWELSLQVATKQYKILVNSILESKIPHL